MLLIKDFQLLSGLDVHYVLENKTDATPVTVSQTEDTLLGWNTTRKCSFKCLLMVLSTNLHVRRTVLK